MKVLVCFCTVLATLLAGCFSPHSNDRPFEYGERGEKLYIGIATGHGDSYEEAQQQALLVAASRAVGVKFESVRKYDGQHLYESTRSRIRAVNYNITIIEQQQLANGQRMVRVRGLFQELGEVPLGLWRWR